MRLDPPVLRSHRGLPAPLRRLTDEALARVGVAAQSGGASRPRCARAEAEDALAIHHVTERLMKAHPELDADLVESAVRTAHEELGHARVRTWLPILMERRARDPLPSDGQADSPT
ncbi:three-helix bundle dimerization domain-containing protein [Streptomyces sp. NBC_01233]|uniref:three-helix bundle dimerization domain-containing protein n=1 Tax=Streptomyces sp. NBC_01233 TaxID=2903787 RepID=UPI003FA3C0C8